MCRRNHWNENRLVEIIRWQRKRSFSRHWLILTQWKSSWLDLLNSRFISATVRDDCMLHLPPPANCDGRVWMCIHVCSVHAYSKRCVIRCVACHFGHIGWETESERYTDIYRSIAIGIRISIVQDNDFDIWSNKRSNKHFIEVKR